MSQTNDRKMNILKIRVNNLIDEHADALAQAQELHHELQQAKIKISDLEQRLRDNDVQEKNSEITIINQPVESAEY